MESLAQIDAALGCSVAGLGLLDVNRLHELHSGCDGNDVPHHSRSHHGRGSRGKSQIFALGPALGDHATLLKNQRLFPHKSRTSTQTPAEIIWQDIHPRKPRAAITQPGRNMRGIQGNVRRMGLNMGHPFGNFGILSKAGPTVLVERF